jgi:hypothetical protein
MFVSSIARRIMSCEGRQESRLGGVFAMRAGRVVSCGACLLLISRILTLRHCC